MEDQIVKNDSEIIIPEDAVFEKAPVTPHDAVVKPTYSDGIHVDGDSKKGEVVEYLHFDNTAGTFTHEMRQDIEPTLNWVKEQHLTQGGNVGKSASGEWYHAARVDKIVIIAWLNARGLKWADFKGDVVDQFLDDSENAPFRVWQGRV